MVLIKENKPETREACVICTVAQDLLVFAVASCTDGVI